MRVIKFRNVHIDLDSITTISDPEEEDFGLWSFEIGLKLHNSAFLISSQSRQEWANTSEEVNATEVEQLKKDHQKLVRLWTEEKKP